MSEVTLPGSDDPIRWSVDVDFPEDCDWVTIGTVLQYGLKWIPVRIWAMDAQSFKPT